MAQMKPFLALLTSLALGGGLVLGYVEHQRERAREASPAPRAAAVPPPPAPAPAAEAVRPEAVRPEAEPEPARPPLPSPEELAAAVREVEGLILKEDFTRAAESARRLVREHGGNPEALRLLEGVRRAERRAQAYSALIASLETRELPEQLYTVSFSNGNTLIARSVNETPERYEIEYVLGGKGSLTRDRVAAVKPLSRGDYLAARWKEIQESVSRYKDPVDLFFFGVRKCFRDGLRREGIGLIDRLLPLADSGQVIAMYARDSEGTAVRSWEQAAGRLPLEPLPGMERQAEPGSPPAGQPGEIEEEGDGMDGAALSRATALMERAEAAFRSGGAFDARILIQSAAKILYGLPARDERVRKLNRRARDLLDKVMAESGK